MEDFLVSSLVILLMGAFLYTCMFIAGKVRKHIKNPVAVLVGVIVVQVILMLIGMLQVVNEYGGIYGAIIGITIFIEFILCCVMILNKQDKKK